MARGGSGTFGLTSRGRGRGSFRSGGYRGGSYRGGRGRGRGGATNSGPAPLREDDGTLLAERFEQIRINDEVDEKLGFARVQEGTRREGWLVNMHPVRNMSAARIVFTILILGSTDSCQGPRLAVRQSRRGLLFHPRRWRHV